MKDAAAVRLPFPTSVAEGLEEAAWEVEPCERTWTSGERCREGEGGRDHTEGNRGDEEIENIPARGKTFDPRERGDVEW